MICFDYFTQISWVSILKKSTKSVYFPLLSLFVLGGCCFTMSAEAQYYSRESGSQHVPARQTVPPRDSQQVFYPNESVAAAAPMPTIAQIPQYGGSPAPASNPHNRVQNPQLQYAPQPQYVPQQQYAQQNSGQNNAAAAQRHNNSVVFPIATQQIQQAPVQQVRYQQDDLNQAPPINGQLHNLPPVVTPEIPKNAVTQTIPLQNLSAAEFKKKLLEKLGSRCVPVMNVQTPGEITHYQMKTASNTLLDLVIDNKGNTIRITGSNAAVGSFLKIAQMLDLKNNTPELHTDMVPFHGGNYKAVQQTISAIRQGQDEGGRSEVRNENTARPTSSATIAEAGETINQMTESGLLGPVQLEVLDGLDYVVIKGNRRDVAIVRELIDQIERTGAEQEPLVVIHPLKNADCTRIGTLVRLLYNEIYGSRRGSISITSLVKPNALLFVGKQESIDTAIELVNKLDTEVDPLHKFKIVRLKYAQSDTVATTLTNFYGNPDQLDTQVRIISDTRTNALIIAASERDMQEVFAAIERLDTADSAAVNEVKIFPLLNSSATDLATLLQNSLAGTTTGTSGGFGGGFGGTAAQGTARRAMLEFRGLDAKEGELLRSGIMTADVRIAADTRGNQLIVTAPADSMPLIEAIIKQLDQLPAAQSKIDVYTIINADASSLYTMLQNLFQTTTGGGGFGGTGGTNNTISAMPGLTEGESAMVQLRFYYDVRTNSIIAIGSEGNLAMVEALLMRLDGDDMQNRVVTVFRLLNSPVTQIASAVNQYLQQERQLETTIDQQLFSTFEQFRKEVIVVPDTITNSLIVSATPRFYNDIRKIIKELDSRPPMVVIQVLIAEVTLNNMNEFGVEFGLQDSILFDRSVNGVPGFGFNNAPLGNDTTGPNTDRVGTQGITNLNLGRQGENGSGGFVFSASSESVSVLLRALEERNKVEVLSRPQINALDNQRASLQVGQNIPYVGQTQVLNSGNTTQSIDWVSVGVILDITPRISADGQVVMSIYAEKSKYDMVDITTTTKAPRVTLSTVQTVVSAMDAQTIVIGGLITNETSQTTRAVPLLSRIPVIGRLFEYNMSKCERKEILVIMTPMVVRSEEDMEIIRNQEQQRIHWCVSDIMSISNAKNLRKRGDYYYPTETQVVPFRGYVPDTQLQMFDGSTGGEMPMLPGAPVPNMSGVMIYEDQTQMQRSPQEFPQYITPQPNQPLPQELFSPTLAPSPR